MALNFWKDHQGAHLEKDRPLWVQRCVEYLVEHTAVSVEHARTIVWQTICEEVSRHHGESIDLTQTTAFALCIRNITHGQREVLALTDILTVMRHHLQPMDAIGQA
jgi:hypothetical protein